MQHHVLNFFMKFDNNKWNWEDHEELTWIFAFHHSLLVEIVPNSLLQPTLVSETNFVHILQSFLHQSHLFFSCVLVNAWSVCSLNDVIRNFHLVLSKWVLGLILISMTLIHRSQNVCNISFVQAALSKDSRPSMISFKTFNKSLKSINDINYIVAHT